MELWVRSQDKECLMKVNRVDYDLSNSEHRIIVNGYETLVGHYKTKERALEVLNEIQNILHPKIIVKKSKEELGNLKLEFAIKEIESFSYDIEQLDTYVYEMPKE